MVFEVEGFEERTSVVSRNGAMPQVADLASSTCSWPSHDACGDQKQGLWWWSCEAPRRVQEAAQPLHEERVSS